MNGFDESFARQEFSRVEKVSYEGRTLLNPLQLQVLKAAASQKLPPILTVAWAVESVAFLGGYLEHRRKTPLGIQVLWRGWLKLHDLCQGWQLAIRT